MKPKSIQLSVPEPCKQDFSKMKPCQQGKFCNKCETPVIDFSTWSDSAIHHFFTNNKEHVCGRFLNTQLHREIQIPYQPHSRLYRLAIATGMVLIFSQVGELRAQTMSPKKKVNETEQSAQMFLPGKLKHSEAAATMIEGKVYNGNMNEVEGITVVVYREGKMIASAETNEDGFYRIHLKEGGDYEIKAKGLFRKKQMVTQIRPLTTTRKDLYLNPKRYSGRRYIMGCPKF